MKKVLKYFFKSKDFVEFQKQLFVLRDNRCFFVGQRQQCWHPALITVLFRMEPLTLIKPFSEASLRDNFVSLDNCLLFL